MKESAPVVGTPVDELPTAPGPAARMRCHCPQDCWVAKATLELVDHDGFSPDIYCLHCAPEPMRSSAAFIIDNRAALGIPEGAPLRVDVEDLNDQLVWPHGGNLN